MEHAEFVNLVSKMRVSQKQYFKTREYAVLQKSKELEKQVDREISEQAAQAIQITLKLED